jgi:SAM-dependent methyltransferase
MIPINNFEQLKRKLGPESAASNLRRIIDGTYSKYMQGYGLDIGYRGERGSQDIQPILPTAIGIDLDYPGYNGTQLPFADNSQGYVYASHILEHVLNPEECIKEWYRVTKPGGYIIITVPHMDLYEQKEAPPSLWNLGHHRFYRYKDFAREIEQSLVPRTFIIEKIQLLDYDYDYSVPPHQHSVGRMEMEAVIRKRG